MPFNVCNSIISFLTGRVQMCKVQDTLSKAIGINLSIVQGSGIGPSLYIIMESDLHSQIYNKLMKYADDTNLLVPETSNCSLCEKYEHIKDWAIANKMVINMSKTKELVSERELKFMFAICHRPSVCLLSVCLSSVTFVRPTRAIEIFGNVSTPFGTLAILDLSVKILRRSSQGTLPSRDLNTRRVSEYIDFSPIELNISETVQDS